MSFHVNILSADENQKLYPIETSKFNQKFIVTNPGQAFQITFEALDPNKVYGVKLLLDGREIKWKKTFRGKGRYSGFKLGAGSYQQFVFSKPESGDRDTMEIDLRSIIEVQFYSTKSSTISKSVLLKKMLNRPINDYIPNKLRDDKKNYQKSICIDRGEFFNKKPVNLNTLLKKKRISDDLYNYETIDYQSCLETIRIVYGDAVSLEINGYLDMTNPNHMKYIKDYDKALLGDLKKFEIIKGLCTKLQTSSWTVWELEKEFLSIVGENFETIFNTSLSSVCHSLTVDKEYLSLDLDGRYRIIKEFKVEDNIEYMNSLTKKGYFSKEKDKYSKYIEKYPHEDILQIKLTTYTQSMKLHEPVSSKSFNLANAKYIIIEDDDDQISHFIKL